MKYLPLQYGVRHVHDESGEPDVRVLLGESVGRPAIHGQAVRSHSRGQRTRLSAVLEHSADVCTSLLFDLQGIVLQDDLPLESQFHPQQAASACPQRLRKEVAGRNQVDR